MHELSVAEDILSVVEKAAGPGNPIEAVHVTLGPLSGICAESLRFCFSEVADYKGFGAPQLIIEETVPKVRCLGCGADYDLKDFNGGCPQCGSLSGNMVAGHEFTVDWIEVPDEAIPET